MMYAKSLNRILQSSINLQTKKHFTIYKNRSYVKCSDFDPFDYDKSNIGIIHNFENENTIKEDDKNKKKSYQIIYTNNLIILGNNKKYDKNIKNE